MRSYRYRKEMNRHWSVSTSRHTSEDDKTICVERALIDDLFFWISSIIFTRDEITDHLSRFFLYLTQIFIFISLLSLSAIWIRAWLTISSFESQSIILTIFAVSSSNANWIQAIYSFESRSIKFVSLRSQSNLHFRKSSNSCNLDSRKPLNPCKIAPQPKLNEDENSELRKVSWDENQEMKDIQSYR
jgi:hypothetical protein